MFSGSTSRSTRVNQQEEKAKSYYNRGVERFESSRYRESIEAFQQAIRLKPDYASAYEVPPPSKL